MAQYPEILRSHLAAYKREVLAVEKDGIWANNQRSYPHILPKEQGRLNLIASHRDEISTYVEERGIKLHRDFHHLNSSQAFTLNLFFPFLKAGNTDQAIMLDALGLPAALSEVHFEAVLDPEEGTNFDLRLVSPAGQALIEVKLTESGFGTAKSDRSHLEKLEKIYRARLASKVANSPLSEDTFFQHYQLFRNLCFAEPSESVMLLVFPRANEQATKEATKFKETLVHPSYRETVRILYVEDLVRSIGSSSGMSPLARKALDDVTTKYMLN